MDTYLRWIQLTGYAIVGLAAILGAWSFLADRIRHRARLRRCPRCWYDMSMVQSLTCPECGRTARHEQRLFRSRRRWFWFALSLLIMTVGAAGAGVRWIKEETWPDRVPTLLLIKLLDPTSPTPPVLSNGNKGSTLTGEQTEIIDELTRRMMNATLSVASRRALAARQFSTSPPLSLIARSRWPANVPVRVQIVGAFESALPREIRAIPTFPGGIPIVAYSGGVRIVTDHSGWNSGTKGRTWSWPRQSNDAGAQSIGIPPAGEKQIEFDVTITENGVPIWSGKHTLAINIDGQTSDFIQPVSFSQIDWKLHDALIRKIEIIPEASSIGFERPLLSELADVCVAMRLEFVHHEKVVAWASFRWRDTASDLDLFQKLEKLDTSSRDEYFDFVRPTTELWSHVNGDAASLFAALQNPGEWHIRIRADEELALADTNPTAYWNGMIEIPLAEALVDR